MRIVCVGYLHGSGGAEKQIINLANALVDLKYEVYFLVLAENNQRFSISNKVKIIDLSFSENQKGNVILNRFMVYKKALKTILPDISIHYWVQSVYFSFILPKCYTGKIIYSERGDPGDAEYNGLLGLVRNISFHRVSHFVFQSNAARDYFPKKIRLRSTVIPNVIDISDVDYIASVNPEEKTIINVGRLHPQKNQKLLIKSFSRIADEIPDYSLKIYGEGELKEELEELINNLGLRNRITIFPPTPSIHTVIMAASLFVLSSDFEGMPNVLLESMALGKICISTDYRPGGVNDIIDDNINGFVVPRNNEEILANKILYVIKHIDELNYISINSKNVKDSHSFRTVFSKWDSLLHEC